MSGEAANRCVGLLLSTTVCSVVAPVAVPPSLDTGWPPERAWPHKGSMVVEGRKQQLEFVTVFTPPASSASVGVVQHKRYVISRRFHDPELRKAFTQFHYESLSPRIRTSLLLSLLYVTSAFMFWIRGSRAGRKEAEHPAVVLVLTLTTLIPPICVLVMHGLPRATIDILDSVCPDQEHVAREAFLDGWNRASAAGCLAFFGSENMESPERWQDLVLLKFYQILRRPRALCQK